MEGHLSLSSSYFYLKFKHWLYLLFGKLVYEDINLISYFASIRQSTRLTFGFRLGRSIIIPFQKRTVIHFFIPRSLRRKKKGGESRRERKKKYAMKIAQWW